MADDKLYEYCATREEKHAVSKARNERPLQIGDTVIYDPLSVIEYSQSWKDRVGVRGQVVEAPRQFTKAGIIFDDAPGRVLRPARYNVFVVAMQVDWEL